MINDKRIAIRKHWSGLVGMPLKWSFNCWICQTAVDGDYSLSILIRNLLPGLRAINSSRGAGRPRAGDSVGGLWSASPATSPGLVRKSAKWPLGLFHDGPDLIRRDSNCCGTHEVGRMWSNEDSYSWRKTAENSSHIIRMTYTVGQFYHSNNK